MQQAESSTDPACDPAGSFLGETEAAKGKGAAHMTEQKKMKMGTRIISLVFLLALLPFWLLVWLGSLESDNEEFTDRGQDT